MSLMVKTRRRPPAFRRGTVRAAQDRPRTARPSRGPTPPAAGRRDGCHAAARWSSAPTTSRSTRFSHDDPARARPLTATAAGMATSWRTGRQHLNQDTEHGARQTAISQLADRSPDSPSACQTPSSDAARASPAHRTRPAQPKPALRNTLHVVKPNGRSLDPEVAAQFHCLQTPGSSARRPNPPPKAPCQGNGQVQPRWRSAGRQHRRCPPRRAARPRGRTRPHHARRRTGRERVLADRGGRAWGQSASRSRAPAAEASDPRVHQRQDQESGSDHTEGQDRAACGRAPQQMRWIASGHQHKQADEADQDHIAARRTSRMPSSRAPRPTGRRANGCSASRPPWRVMPATARLRVAPSTRNSASVSRTPDPARPGRGPSASGPRKKNCQPRINRFHPSHSHAPNSTHRPTGDRVTARVTWLSVGQPCPTISPTALLHLAKGRRRRVAKWSLCPCSGL